MKKSIRILQRIAVVSVFLLVLLLQPSAANAQANVTLKISATPLKQVIEEIEKQSGYNFLYNARLLNVSQKVSISKSNAPLKEVLNEVFKATDISYKIVDKQIILSPKESSSAAGEGTPASSSGSKSDGKGVLKVKGTVYDEKGNPIPGATVRVNGTTIGTATNIDGFYTINVPHEKKSLLISFIGYSPVEIEANERIACNVTLNPDSQKIDEVIVTGYQTISKERATGSFAVITPKELEGKLQTNIMDRLEGKIAGLTSYKGKLQIRGVSTISGVNTPLYVVDGVPYEGDIAAINPSEIVNVTILKDATATSIYGARSANGVIVITTRGGKISPTKVYYNGSIKLSPFYDTDYLNLMTSSEFVDFQQTLFNINPGTKNDGYYLNEVRQLLFDHKDGLISTEDLNKQLDIYRSRDRKDQALDLFVRTPAIVHQHNLGFSGGSEKHTYALSFNYMQNMPYEKSQKDDRIGFNVKNTFNFYKWFKVDVGLLGSIATDDYYNGYTGVSDVTGKGTASYLLYYDENGNPLPWYMQKSQAEIDRLIGLGLLDESSHPTSEMNRRRYESKDSYLNLNMNLNFKIVDGLTFDLRFQKDFKNSYSKQFDSKDSWIVKNMVNNATQIIDNEIIYNIPTGGQVVERRGDANSYTLRGQLNYNHRWNDKHNFSAIAGAERRAVISSSTGVYKVGYDDNSLSYKVIDEKLLGKTIDGTQALGGRFTYSSKEPGFAYNENRYVSFYANASYTYDNKLSFNGSIRIDQSNLFGTDPKYQYRPLWSLGSQYVISEKDLPWLNRLVLRATYGINGNIPKLSGPYLTVKDGGVNSWTNDFSSFVSFPPNSGLRWEKTGVWNVALDFDMLSSKLNGSIEFYNKKTSDLLYNKTADPTLGWPNVMVNYGDMYNRGVEITLNSTNIAQKDFTWTSGFNFSYNKNKVIRLENSNTDAIYYINNPQIREGGPMNGLYSVRWAGLDENGAPQAYTKDGKVVKSFANLAVDDLVYSGVTTPPYAASLSNSLRYKNINLSFLFTYYGGHVMRGMFGNYLINTGYSTNQDRLTGNFWQKPGDENDPSKAPALKMGAQANMQNLWKAADKHVQKGDYIKLNEVILEYSLPTSILRRTFIDNVSCSFQVQNVWKWAANDMDLDPEAWIGTSLTPSRGIKNPTTYSIGLSLKF